MRREIYNINVGRWGQMLLPTFEKVQAFWVLWHTCLLEGFKLCHKDFLFWGREQRALALSNSQTAVLAYNLNRLYDSVLQRIYIVNHTVNEPTNPAIQFTVFIPDAVNPETVKSFVQRFALLDKSYQIETL